jgi:MFS family permease
VLVAAGYVLLALYGTRGAFAASAFYGIGNGVMWPSYLSMLSATGPPSTRGRLQGVASSAGSTASIAGMIGGGAAFELLGGETFLVAAAALLGAGVIFAADRATVRR